MDDEVIIAATGAPVDEVVQKHQVLDHSSSPKKKIKQTHLSSSMSSQCSSRGGGGDDNDVPPFSSLPDDILAVVASAVGVYCDARSFVMLSRTNRRMNRIMITSQNSPSQVVDQTTSTETDQRPDQRQRHQQQQQFSPSSKLLPEILHRRTIDTNVYKITNLRQWGLYERFQQSCLKKDNRVKFEFATMAISFRDRATRRNIQTTRKILQQFSSSRRSSSTSGRRDNGDRTGGDNDNTDADDGSNNNDAEDDADDTNDAETLPPAGVLQIVLDAHCGIPAPPPIAPQFSRHRGIVVRDAIVNHNNNDDRRQERIFNPFFHVYREDDDDDEDGDEDNDIDDDQNEENADDDDDGDDVDNEGDTNGEVVDDGEEGGGQNHTSIVEENHIIVRPWGRRVTTAAAQSDHRFSIQAREGKVRAFFKKKKKRYVCIA